MSVFWFICGLYILASKSVPSVLIGGSPVYSVPADSSRRVGFWLLIPICLDLCRVCVIGSALEYLGFLIVAYLALTYAPVVMAILEVHESRTPLPTGEDGLLVGTKIPAQKANEAEAATLKILRAIFFLALSSFGITALVTVPLALVQVTQAIRIAREYELPSAIKVWGHIVQILGFVTAVIVSLSFAFVAWMILTSPAWSLTGRGQGQMLGSTLTPIPTSTSTPTSASPSTSTLTPTLTSTLTPTLTSTATFANTSTSTLTPTLTSTATSIYTLTPTLTSTATSIPTLTPTPDEHAHVLAKAGAARNADWTPYTEAIGGALMALVPAGCFNMGSDNDGVNAQPVHEVCFKEPFWIDIYEVTNAQYGSSGKWSGDDLPREAITWIQADAFCHEHGKRLPTEAEWEYAARGPDDLIYPWGNDDINDNAVWGASQPANVGSRPGGVSWVGAFDLSGNVWEWVNDWYSSTYYDTLANGVVNPQGPTSGDYRGSRGGFFKGYDLSLTRSARRGGDDPSKPSIYGGFRCARSYKP